MKRTVAVIALLATGVAGGAWASGKLEIVKAPSIVRFVDHNGTTAAQVWRDPETGCEYLFTMNGPTPRLGANGLPKCGGAQMAVP